MPKCGYRSIAIKKNQWFLFMIVQLHKLLKVGNKFYFSFLQFSHLTFIYVSKIRSHMYELTEIQCIFYIC